MKNNIFSELAAVCFFAAAIFACFMGMATTATAHLVFGLAAVVRSIVFVVSLIAEAKKLGLKA